MANRIVTNNTELKHVCEQMAGLEYIALDTEFERRNTYYPIPALIQMSAGDDVFLIDPLTITHWSSIKELFVSDATFLMHSCSEDLEVLRDLIGVLPVSAIDTQIAAALLGLGDSIGYANLVAEMLSVQLDKSETRSDWLARPLSDSQLQYAAMDVHYLWLLWSDLKEKLIQLDRYDWALDEYRELQTKYQSEEIPERSWLRVKGISKIPSSNWGVARDLAAWRESLCRKIDKPKSWIMSDKELIAIATELPSSEAEIKSIPGISGNTIRRNKQVVLDIVNGQKESPHNHDNDCEVTPLRELSVLERKLLKQCQTLVNELSELHGISARLIANKQTLAVLIARKDNDSRSMDAITGWRNALAGKALSSIIYGDA